MAMPSVQIQVFGLVRLILDFVFFVTNVTNIFVFIGGKIVLNDNFVS